jgi:hypothetical protein
MIGRPGKAFLVGVLLLAMAPACAHLRRSPALEEDCIGRILLRVEESPELEAIRTLDRQTVALAEFFDACDRVQPRCILYRKFYHWPHETRTVVSPAEKGNISHGIRAYLNPQSVCHPERSHPGARYGDVAEFYDAAGEFMGLAVHMGQGRYYPLPWSGYSKHREGIVLRLAGDSAGLVAGATR